jgi:hypothetical protein
VAGSCEYTDEPSGSGATELVVSMKFRNKNKSRCGIPAYTGPFFSTVCCFKPIINTTF